MGSVLFAAAVVASHLTKYLEPATLLALHVVANTRVIPLDNEALDAFFAAAEDVLTNWPGRDHAKTPDIMDTSTTYHCSYCAQDMPEPDESEEYHDYWYDDEPWQFPDLQGYGEWLSTYRVIIDTPRHTVNTNDTLTVSNSFSVRAEE